MIPHKNIQVGLTSLGLLVGYMLYQEKGALFGALLGFLLGLWRWKF